ncbi:MAG: peptide chain release factor N(5)-glutamine methyltransferase [Clostridia bacterium]|nr:peptide chain release factor N(5)-glutamine methyltransferase [Clostridia bacterium]
MNYFVFPNHKGIVVQGEDKKVVTIVDCNGQKKLKSFHTKNKIIFWHFPFARGVQFFFCGLFALLQSILLSQDMCSGVVIKKNKKELNSFYKKKLIYFMASIFLGISLSALLLGVIPSWLGFYFVGVEGSFFFRNVVIFLWKLAMLFLILVLLRIFPTVNEFFAFNRAGEIESQRLLGKIYKTRLARSSKDDKQLKGKKQNEVKKHLRGKNGKQYNNVRKKRKNETMRMKNRSFFAFESINFLNFIVFVLFLDYLVVTLWGANYGFWFNLVLKIAIFFVCLSVAYEILIIFENCKPLRFLGWISRIFVFAKPTRTHLETASIAFAEINLLCTQKGREFMQEENGRAFSIVYLEVKNRLAAAGVTDKSDADWLIATVLGKNRAEMKLVATITEKQYEQIMNAVERRTKGESLDNIFGWTEFYGLEFDVNKKVLTPRMETELLVERVLLATKNFKNCTVLDLGTGSGAIAISVAKNSDASVTAVDISKSALATAQSNAKKNDVQIEFLHSNLFEDLKRKRKFDIIVSNPPYIPSAEIATLDKNVRECDPVLALDGGQDGLDFYREISRNAGARLNSGGMIFYEVGKGQALDVKKILKECGFEDIKIFKDYNNIERIVCGKIK